MIIEIAYLSCRLPSLLENKPTQGRFVSQLSDDFEDTLCELIARAGAICEEAKSVFFSGAAHCTHAICSFVDRTVSASSLPLSGPRARSLAPSDNTKGR